MKHSPLYNGQNLNFTGSENPYGLIQNAGKRKLKKSRKTIYKKKKNCRSCKRKTRKYRN